MPFIKLNQPKYLSEGQYLIADTDPDSTYFDVSEVPDILTGGKNLFMLKGNKSLLAPGSTIEIEVTDLNGRAIYHENAVYLEPGTKRRAVAIYVYDHTPQGGGVITITGTAQKRPNGKSVSLKLQETPNVKWQKKINVLPQNENRTRVILNRTPVVQIKEVEKTYWLPSGGLLTNFETIQSQITHPAGGYISYTRTNEGGTLTTTSSFFVEGMAGSSVNIYGITSDHMQYWSDGQPFITNTLTNGTQNFVSNTGTLPVITEIENSTIAHIDIPWVTSVTTTEAPHSLPGGGYDSGGSFILPSSQPDGFTEGPHFIITYETETTWAGSELNSQSWAKVDIAELDPICGDIKRLAVYKKSQGVQQWHFVTDVILENQELLANDSYQGLNQNLGEFRTQGIVNNYWTSSYGGYSDTAIGSNPSKISDSTVFLNGVLISGSENLVSVTTAETRLDAYAEFRMKPSADWNSDGTSTAGLALKANTSYILSMKLAGQQIDDGVNYPIIKIFASGSAIDLPSEDSTMRKFATIQANSQWEGQDGQIAIVDESTLNYHFDVSTAGDMAVVFRITSGRWWISDVSVKPASQTGFTPNHTSVEFPMMQAAQQNDVVDFKFELYDNVDNLVHTEVTRSLAWSGGNTYINGDNNVIEGSLTIGGGIVMDGVSTG
jgi:hypothetical protein